MAVLDQVVELPPAEVTLFEDRAYVVRRGTVTLPAGEVTLRVEGAAPVISDRTLSTQLAVPAPGVEVVDTRVHRETKVSLDQQSEDLKQLELELQAVDEELARAGKAAALVEEQLANLRQLSLLSSAEIGGDVSRGRGDLQEWNETVQLLEKQQRELVEDLGARVWEHRQIERRRADLAARLDERRRRERSLRCWLLIRLSVKEPATCTLLCSYMVPSACWRPAHRARMSGERLAFATDGCAWQNTGEDWSAVKLGFSTQRLSRGTEPPRLVSDMVVTVRKQPEVVIETRLQQVTSTGPSGTAKVDFPGMPGIDDGGETRLLWATAPVTIRSDGRPHRVPIFEFETPITTSWSSMPELVAGVFLVSDQVNTHTAPILAGPVDLVRESGFVGRSSVLFVAPGQRFTLSWGTDPSFSVHRETEAVEEEQSLLGSLSSWSSKRHQIISRVSNLGPMARLVEVKERIPVSEVDKVQILMDPAEVTGKVTVDADGFLQWKLPLAPFGHTEVKVVYRMRKHRDVVEH
jgi:hypothetical protein